MVSPGSHGPSSIVQLFVGSIPLAPLEMLGMLGVVGLVTLVRGARLLADRRRGDRRADGVRGSPLAPRDLLRSLTAARRNENLDLVSVIADSSSVVTSGPFGA